MLFSVRATCHVSIVSVEYVLNSVCVTCHIVYVDLNLVCVLAVSVELSSCDMSHDAHAYTHVCIRTDTDKDLKGHNSRAPWRCSSRSNASFGACLVRV